MISLQNVLVEVMSVYQSSILGDEGEDERDTGFQQVMDIMVTPVSSMCVVLQTSAKTTITPM